MHWFKRDLWKSGIIVAGVLLLLMLMTWVPVSAASAHEETAGLATPGTVMVQATPTGDATVTALTKSQLTQQVAGQQHTWDNWLWSNAATVLSSFLSTLVIVIGTLFGLWRWRRERQDAQDKELKERQKELEKRAEERFQTTVTGLGDEKEGARIGAAILLRTFLRPGYEEFYTQTFDLAVANLRLPRTARLSEEDPDALHTPTLAGRTIPVPLTTLSQALITVFKEAFPLARSKSGSSGTGKEALQYLDATGIHLDRAYLSEADLKRVWMPKAFLREANLVRADLSEANLTEADLRNANLSEANLTEADLRNANLHEADLRNADLSRVNLYEADLTEAVLCGAYLKRADLGRANLSGAYLSSLLATSLQGADLTEARLWGANLGGAHLSGANLGGADLSMANLSGANFSMANLRSANLIWSHLSEADLSGANLSQANLEKARFLKDTNLHGVTGLTKEQLAICKAKGAIIDEDSTTSSPQSTVAPLPPERSPNAQASSAPSAQGSPPSPDTDGSGAASSHQQDSES